MPETPTAEPEVTLRGHMTPAWTPIKPGGLLSQNNLLRSARLFHAKERVKNILVDAGYIVLYAELAPGWIFYVHARRQSFGKMLRRQRGKTLVSDKFRRLCMLLADTAVSLGSNDIRATLHCYEAQSLSYKPSQDIAEAFAANAPAELDRWLTSADQFPGKVSLDCRVVAVDRMQLPTLQLAAGNSRGVAVLKTRRNAHAVPATAT